MDPGASHLVPESLLWLAATSTLLCLTISLVYVWWQHPLYGRNRGPKIFPIVGCLPQMLMNSNSLYDWVTAELKKTPTMTMRVVVPGLEYIETGNPSNVEHILKTRFEDYIKGDFVGRLFFDLLGKGIFNVDGNLWKLQRKVASQEFNTRTLRDYVVDSVRKELAYRFIPVFETACDTSAIVDLQDLLLRFTFNSISQLAFGTDPGCLDPSLPSVPFAKAFDDAVVLCTLRALNVLPPWQVKKFFNIGSERKLREALSIIDAYAMDIIQTRRKELLHDRDNQHLNLLSRFINVVDEIVESPQLEEQIKQDPRSKYGQPSDFFLRDIVISFVLAGRDTTACGLTWFFWVLSSNPKAEAKIYDEIQATRASRREFAKDPEVDAKEMEEENALFSYEELKDLHYLHAALTESMRLYPPVPDDSKVAVADDVFPDGTIIAKGTRISFHMYGMGRSESIWGADCLEFRPERFLKDGIFVPPSPFDYPVFQAGPRICLGKEMAMNQMKLIAAALLSRYVFEVKEGHRAHYDWSITMKIQEGLPVRVRRRGRLIRHLVIHQSNLLRMELKLTVMGGYKLDLI